MKYIIIFFFMLFLVSSCRKEDRKSGICYCEFFQGDDQQYDLSTMTRDEQVLAFNTHDNNAAKFGGNCELE